MVAIAPSSSYTPLQTEPQRQNDSAWHAATWAEYERWRDDPNTSERLKLYFHNGYLRVDAMGWEGINHAQVRELFVMLFLTWFAAHPNPKVYSMGGCLFEKAGLEAASPDLALYLGDDAPQWNEGEPRRIDLDRWRVPDLVGEVADTTLATDLDEMKQLYAALGIREYWVIDVRGRRVLMFQLQPSGKYQQQSSSAILAGLSVDLLEQTLERWPGGGNVGAALWFQQAIAAQ